MMDCAECRKLLVGYVEGLFEGSEEQAVGEHLNACDACRKELRDLAGLQQDLVRDGATPAWTSLEDEVMNRIIREQNVRLKSAHSAGAGLRPARLFHRGPAVRIAVAAAVVLAAVGGVFLWTGTRSGVVLAGVLARVEQVRAFTYRVESRTKMAAPGSAPIEMDVSMTMLVADGYGMRIDVNTPDPNTGQMMQRRLYVLPEKKMVLTLAPERKQYERIELDDSLLQAKRQESNDPRLMIRRMLRCPYRDLGETVVDGVEVRGFQTTDPSLTGGFSRGDATLWADVKTGLPVRMDVKITLNEQSEMRTSLYDFQWHVPVSEAQFNPVIPADFTPGVADGTRTPAMTEQGAIEGLQLCVEYLGEYPEDLNPTNLLATFLNPGTGSTPAARKLAQEIAEAKSREETAAKTVEAMKPLQSLVMFYMSLAQEKKEPVYHGEVVRPGDAAQVLLRWKTGDNAYRVLFGDLHALTVDADTLARLEEALPSSLSPQEVENGRQ